jgi:hypothetical protein
MKNPNNSALAVARLRWLVAGLPPQRPIHVGFVADKVALGQVLLLVLRSYPVRIISTHMHLKFYNDQLNAQVFNVFNVSGFLLAHFQRRAYNFGSGSSLLGM